LLLIQPVKVAHEPKYTMPYLLTTPPNKNRYFNAFCGSHFWHYNLCLRRYFGL